MRRRGLYFIGILLLCFLLGSCTKNENSSQYLLDNQAEINTETSPEINTYTSVVIDTEASTAIITEVEDLSIDEADIRREDIDITMNGKEETIRIKNVDEDLGSLVSDKTVNHIDDIAFDNMDEDEVATVYYNQSEALDVDSIIQEHRAYPAGMVIDIADFDREVMDSLSIIEELNQETIDRIRGKSYKDNCDIPYSDLRYIRVLHMGFDGDTHIGEMIVNKAIASEVVDIFKELYVISYPIEKMILIDEYDADDIKSMEDNNSSAFNFRFVDGTTRRSVHSDGLAIDINPLYNPYVRVRDGKTEVLPESGLEYTFRDKENEYYIRKDDPCYKAFINRGFTWGGEWKNSKDYQHFEKEVAE